MPKYYPINEEAARRAKNANSFSDYVPGSATAAYREMVDRAYTLGKQQKGRVDPMYHEKIDGLIDRYARKLAENINQCNLIDARVPSILIAGGSNFPVRKKEKQNAARDKNMGEYMQIEGLLDKVRSTGMGGISADDDRAVEKLEAKLAGLEAMQEEMKTVNAYYRKHKTLEGCPVLSAEEIGKLQSSMASDWRKNPVPYPSYLLTNNNANIRRTRQRIEDLSQECGIPNRINREHGSSLLRRRLRLTCGQCGIVYDRVQVMVVPSHTRHIGMILAISFVFLSENHDVLVDHVRHFLCLRLIRGRHSGSNRIHHVFGHVIGHGGGNCI